MNNSIFAALVVGALAIAMVAATVVTPDALAIRGEAGNHIPQQADDHMSDQGKISAGCIGTLESCPDGGGDGGNECDDPEGCLPGDDDGSAEGGPGGGDCGGDGGGDSEDCGDGGGIEDGCEINSDTPDECP